jgi:hypothetical protein
MASEPSRKAKGTLLLQHVKTIRKAKDERLLEGLPPEDRRIITSRILPSSWYPYEVYARTLQIVYEHFFEGKPEGAINMGKFMAVFLLQGHYSLYLKAGDPAATLRAFRTIWQNFFSFGRTLFEATEKLGDEDASNRIAMGLEAFPDIPRPLCLIVQGLLLKSVELAGGEDPTLQEESCAALGDGRCYFRVAWRKVLAS